MLISYFASFHVVTDAFDCQLMIENYQKTVRKSVLNVLSTNLILKNFKGPLPRIRLETPRSIRSPRIEQPQNQLSTYGEKLSKFIMKLLDVALALAYNNRPQSLQVFVYR